MSTLSLAGRTVAAVAAVVMLTACDRVILEDKPDPLGTTLIDAAEIQDLLLTVGDPEESAAYFAAALQQEPNRADFRRGLALSLTRAKRFPEAARTYQEMIALNQDGPQDLMEYAFLSARLQKWSEAEGLAASLPGGFDTPRRHLLEAMLADHRQSWSEADAAYARAESLSTNPAGILNNWGVSRMSRGDFNGAEQTFMRALSFNSRLFSAKNNLAIVRGLQGNFQLPVVPMTEKEKAMILNNLGIIALRQGRNNVAKGLFAAAVETHPQHYASASDRLAALEAVVEN